MESMLKLPAIDGSKATLYSFDLFETLIERDTVEPRSIFHLMQRELLHSPLALPDYVRENWATLRRRAEADARYVVKQLAFLTDEDRIEVTLDDIYQRIADAHDVDADTIHALQRMEIDAEISHCQEVPARVDWLCRLRDQGCNVVIITDTYLSRAALDAILRRAAPRLTGVPIFISSELGCQKGTGAMYKHIYSRLGRGCQRWVHYGDNAFADGRVPNAFGIEGNVHATPAFLHIEKELVQAASGSLRYDAYRVAAMVRQHRIALLGSVSSRELAQRHYGYAYVGSALVPYVIWCLRQALKQGLKTLYFIARDGYILKAVADDLIAAQKLPLQTKYIYGSRAVWRVAAFPKGSIDLELFGSYGNFYAARTFDDLVRASLLPEAELLEICPPVRQLQGLGSLTREAIDSVVDVLQSSHPYFEKIQQIAAARRPLAVEYLRQEIDFDEPHAFVEFWGTGYTQLSLTRLLNEAAGRDVGSTFYYVRSFYGSHKNVIRKNFLVTSLSFGFFEAIFSDIDYHSIKSYYRDEGGKVRPDIHRKNSIYFDCFVDGARKFAADLMRWTEPNDAMLRWLSSTSFFYQSMGYGDPFICAVFGELEFDFSGYDAPSRIAPPLTVEGLQRVLSAEDLRAQTLSVPISYVRSSDAAKQYYDATAERLGLTRLHGLQMQASFPQGELANMVRAGELPYEVVALANLPVYSSVELSAETRRAGVVITAGTRIEVSLAEYASDGQLRLLTQLGYVDGSSGCVRLARGVRRTRAVRAEVAANGPAAVPDPASVGRGLWKHACCSTVKGGS